MQRKRFIQMAGGVFESDRSYSRWTGRDRYEHFWAFFDGPNGDMPSIYSGIKVRDLFAREEFSIEHIVPMDFIYQHMHTRNKRVRRGASVNPFNLAACHRDVNRKRGHTPFDFDSDKIVLSYDLDLHGRDQQNTGHDRDFEWVVPPRTRGDVARASLYMCLIYDLRGFDRDELMELSKWALGDSPSKWEKAFCAWVKAREGICNPFIDRDQRELLTDDELMGSLLR